MPKTTQCKLSSPAAKFLRVTVAPGIRFLAKKLVAISVDRRLRMEWDDEVSSSDDDSYLKPRDREIRRRWCVTWHVSPMNKLY